MPGTGVETGPEALRKAHSLSAEAHALLDAPSSTLAKLRSALIKYEAALSIYEATAHAKSQAAESTAVSGARSGPNAAPDRTLDLLISQHRRLVKDVERKIEAAERVKAAAARADGAGAAGSLRQIQGPSIPGLSLGQGMPGPSRISRCATDPIMNAPPPSGATERKSSFTGASASGSSISTGTGTAPTGMPAGPGQATSTGIGLASLARPPPPTRPGFMASRTSFTPPRGVPPFARPPSSAPFSSTAAPSSHTSHPSQAQAHPAATAPRTLSPLYSMHSSTSSSEPGESFISVGPYGATRHIGDVRGGVGIEQDPFNRFWAMLDGALDNISRPVAFASAPIGREVDVGELREGLMDLKVGKEHGNGEADEGQELHTSRRPVSPSESFYLIPSHHPAHHSHPTPSTQPPTSKVAATLQTSAKTPEELELENTNLRASLDALAIHTDKVEKENAALKRGIKGREDLLRSVVGEVRQQAEKARIDQSILASQHLPPPPTRHVNASASSRVRHTLSASTVPTSAAATRTLESDKTAGPATGGHNATNPPVGACSEPSAEKRIAELEAQLAALRSEIDKQAAQIIKYKDRFERIKANARAKRDAKGE